MNVSRHSCGALALAGLLVASMPAAPTPSLPADPPADRPRALDEDERRIWNRVREEEEMLDGGGFLVTDPRADDYLNAIVAGLHPGPLPAGAAVHVKILLDPLMNAFALPDGTIYVHTGLLARVQNEAQLAAILGHELTHAEHRHAVLAMRNTKSRTAIAATFTVVTAGVGGILGVIGGNSAISGYARDLERDADSAGFHLAAQAGYDVREFPKVFRLLLEESKRAKIREPYFFGNHPRLQERIESYDQLVAASARQGTTGSRIGAAEYDAALADIYLTNAGAALRAANFDAALASVGRRLAVKPADRAARLLEAEVHRKRDDPGDTEAALRIFRELVSAEPELADAQRGLGLVAFRSGDTTAAAEAFRRYLVLKPSADDRAYIESYLTQCAKKS